MNNLKKALLLSLAWYEGATCAISMETVSMEVERRGEDPFHSHGYKHLGLESGGIGLKDETPTLTRKRNIIAEEIKKIKEERESFISILKKYNYREDIQEHRRVKEYNNIINNLEEYQKSVDVNDKEEEIKNKIRSIQQEYHPVYDK